MTWRVPATVVRVIDADTIVVTLDLGWRVYRNDEHVRVAGINAPERGTKEGDAATVWARSLLQPGMRVQVVSSAKPSFERTVGAIELADDEGWFDYGDLAVEEGQAGRV